ncbi:regulator of chromatin subfamily A member 3-like 1 [Seminavis robusta]|uniref:Regulator of chromatin subfamily A member 3-like 1 n=1 Tax=Seminavis robusta TaxID=568900 RepID=A0A9N8EN56_9STRA|nr:regulator of chromatin subfamily A member 3-like 1 [Seminavis robusta]|eukprot:Sro1370_g266980.1 regulator of chromatin subfamily A member 3-like 1 (1458) ;mRNA; f:4795-9427
MAKRPSDSAAVIDLCCSSDDEEQDKKLPASVFARKKIKTEPFTKVKSEPRYGDDDDEVQTMDVTKGSGSGEVEVVAPVTPKIVPAKQSSSEENDDNDVVLVGAANIQKLPHLRQHCPEHKFDSATPKWSDYFFYSRDTINVNEQHCDMCYCFACDCLVKDCCAWTHAVSSDMEGNHCCANDGFRVWSQRRTTAVKRRQDLERNGGVQTNAARASVALNTTTTTVSPMRAATSTIDPRLTSGEFHLREHCPTHKFQEAAIDFGRILSFPVIANNEECCRQCWCYPCDKPAKQCKSWRKPGKYNLKFTHCCATQTGAAWVQERIRINPTKTLHIDAVVTHAGGIGPWAPEHEVAGKDKTLTKCRHCGWYTRFSHMNFATPALPTGCHDWCHKCGRVASEKDLNKSAVGFAYSPKATDVSLGEKVIPFRLHAHDPLEMNAFKLSWEQNKNSWTYDEADMEEELFLHRFGARPTVDMILASLPIVREVPKDGVVKPTGNKSKLCSAVETEAILLEKANHKSLLEVLYNCFGTVATNPKDGDARARLVSGEILAEFDKSTRKGVLRMRLFLSASMFDTKNAKIGLLKAREGREKEQVGSQFLPCPPFSWSQRDRSMNAISSRRATMRPAIGDQKKTLNAFRGKLSLLPSSGSHVVGGVCLDDTSLSGCLKRYSSETFPERLYEAAKGSNRYLPYPTKNQSTSRILDSIYSESYWIESNHGVVSHHRRMNDSTAIPRLMPRITQDSLKGLERLVGSHDEVVLAATNMAHDSLRLIAATNSIKGMLEQLENLGHRSLPYCEGLNIELLEFQKQGVQFALDRENCPGGIQSFWWGKLPLDTGSHNEIYFNPILSTFRKGKPQLVRGGFIGSEMGLGKTVLSLALILCNPAPEAPVSGSHVKKLKQQTRASLSGSVGWDEDLYARTSKGCSKRGSIVSRGTLVVCPVSLVGQWIEEAKSKLKEPGLVYAYHGQSRRRDPMLLAKNSIIVTTYEVIASDANYHAKKSQSADYVAPLEQVRWWRIIADEGHSLRQGNTRRSEALLRIVADHKWLVSGTPVNTTLGDLRNQLTFLGVEEAGPMMEKFKETAFVHAVDPSVGKHAVHTMETPSFGNLLFFLRNIMLRHTQKQTYRGTSTTLMMLPKKTERTVEIDFEAGERKQYAEVENAAKTFYLDFKAKHGGTLSSHYFKLTQKLMKSRIACAGGRYPVGDAQDPKVEEEDDEDVDDDEALDNKPKKKNRKKEVVYSDVAFRSKLKVLITELMRVRDDDPTSKSLVFSQFASTLQYLQSELPKAGFQFRTLKGSMSMQQRAKALHDFQADPPTTIFLLSMRSGNVGLNLTSANRIYILEPCFNPALELQAIGRVHRLGQKRTTLITRYVMKDSVETRIMKLRAKKYGSSSATDSKEDTKTKAAGVQALLGNVCSDRATIAGEEFDLLYGVPSDEQPEAVFSGSGGPDDVVSSSNSLAI